MARSQLVARGSPLPNAPSYLLQSEAVIDLCRFPKQNRRLAKHRFRSGRITGNAQRRGSVPRSTSSPGRSPYPAVESASFALGWHSRLGILRSRRRGSTSRPALQLHRAASWSLDRSLSCPQAVVQQRRHPPDTRGPTKATASKVGRCSPAFRVSACSVNRGPASSCHRPRRIDSGTQLRVDLDGYSDTIPHAGSPRLGFVAGSASSIVRRVSPQRLVFTRDIGIPFHRGPLRYPGSYAGAFGQRCSGHPEPHGTDAGPFRGLSSFNAKTRRLRGTIGHATADAACPHRNDGRA